MKKLILFAFLTTFLLFSVTQVLALCTNSADDYAVEVVLNKQDINYNLNRLNNDNIVIQNNQYLMHSSNPILLLILERQSELTCGYNSGLSVRLQIPLEAEEKTFPYLKFSSTNTKNYLNIPDTSYNDWQVSCFQGNPIPQCEFKKGKTSILASLIGNKYEVTIETSEDLKQCSLGCDGRCIETKCISQQLKEDIEDILQKAGLINSFDSFLTSYRIISSGSIVKTDLVPESTNSIDWAAAFNQELENLNNKGVISISSQDINQISELAKQGAAGINSRIVYDGEKWNYYSQTKFSSLTKLVNCKEYSFSLMPTGLAISENKISTYYLVPIIMTAALIILLVLLVLAARITDMNKRRQKIKPLTSLKSSQN